MLIVDPPAIAGGTDRVQERSPAFEQNASRHAVYYSLLIEVVATNCAWNINSVRALPVFKGGDYR